jgi:23S rRNA (guanosine2251-2'-O)-methyltransferase
MQKVHAHKRASDMGEEKLYSVHAVTAALEGRRRRIEKVCVDGRRRDAVIQAIVDLAAQRGIPVEIVTSAQLQRMLGHSHHQGVVALVEPVGYQSFSEAMMPLFAAQKPSPILLLDEVTDVGNFAALLRSAVAFGVQVILLPRHRSVPLTPTVAKLSAGALERVSVVQVTNVVHTLDELKHEGFWIFGADVRATTPVSRVEWPDRLVLVLGAEGRGMRRLVRERCDTLVHVPMQAGVDSLNVAVAGAIILAYIWDWRDMPASFKGQTTAVKPDVAGRH